ncbi:MAG TPA: bifunctional 5,10-methylenetetrahydrofolate dehydrogenase/5,10-methenyltetrahydrofolate cyclohydrolase [Phototrophicaceae bacterium]|jgi:5,10-methylene-tetrahydrofolate dehydrogenase/methenyl tetrahydrofolate cyclohydrolase|nr:bifunctional 5,10-methylenetetrahydrofolate dehydrogenase/5,10-methenyltetrahydrofolate cyclohydrolase [Phototrophicaceae bacterium]
MSAVIIDGQAVAARMQAEVTAEAEAFKNQYGYPPGLGVVLVGENPASQMYVRMKRRACQKAGIDSIAHFLPADATQAEVEAAVKSLNDDPKVHGILVQLPLPKHINEEKILNLISLDKDVDGIHPLNVGLLGMKGREPLFTPATPTGCMILLREAGIQLAGANAVVLGRSNIVGMPVALMLIKENATVTVCHSKTKDLQGFLENADIVIAAMGLPEFVKGSWLKPGAAVIDVGSNQIDDPTAEKGYRYVGDVEYESASQVAGAITKVPGGVGPMTITMLIYNTMKAARRIAEATV